MIEVALVDQYIFGCVGHRRRKSKGESAEGEDLPKNLILGIL